MTRAAAPDGAGRLLGWTVRLLPSGQQDWGRAMRAELAALGRGRRGGASRWAARGWR